MKFSNFCVILMGALSLAILPGWAQGTEKTAKAEVVQENPAATAATGSLAKPGQVQDPGGLLLCQMGRGMMEGREGMPCGPGMGQGYQQQALPASSSGADLFNAHCASCHPGGGNNITPNLPLQGSAKLRNFSRFRAFVRHPRMPNGERGAMPAFSAGTISNRQMQRLYRYLKSRWGG